LLEVGLGGRLDATNVIARPAATAITPVSLDHQAFLGDRVAAIAGEKAGILKPGVPAIIGPQAEEAEAVIEARASEIAAPLYRSGIEWRCDLKPLSRTAGEGGGGRRPTPGEGGGMRYVGTRWELDLPLPSLPGMHQIANAGTAIACLEQMLQFSLSPAAIADGLRRIDWPARMQRLTRGPLVDALPQGWELWLDGGHNPAAGEVIADVINDWHDRPLDLIVGMLKTKDASGFLRPLAPHAPTLYAVTIPGEENPHPATEIVKSARSVGISAHEAESVESALRELVQQPGPARVLICGSLHFAGVVLAENG
jgi:dihydrofolate synthase/folylpolyglutamate synthase